MTVLEIMQKVNEFKTKVDKVREAYMKDIEELRRKIDRLKGDAYRTKKYIDLQVRKYVDLVNKKAAALQAWVTHQLEQAQAWLTKTTQDIQRRAQAKIDEAVDSVNNFCQSMVGGVLNTDIAF